MDYFLTHEDRVALLERAMEDTDGVGYIDYFAKLIEHALADPNSLEELKTDRGTAPAGAQPIKVEAPTFLRIVK